jgi:hypothetical protein
MNPLGPIYSVQFVILLVCAAAFYKAADLEDRSGILWAASSAVTFLLTWLVFHWGLPGDLLGQGALLGAITLIRVLKAE